MWRNCHILVFEWLSINLVELLKQNNHVGESLDDTRIIGTVYVVKDSNADLGVIF